MRYAWLLVFGCSSSPRSSELPVDPAPPLRLAAMDAGADAYVDPDDPDLDRIRGHCDLCPDEPETWNGILDEDGCPDSSGISHAVIEHPTNRYAQPVALRFRDLELLTPFGGAMFDDGIEAIEVVGRARVGDRPQVAAKRAARVARTVRTLVLSSVHVAERLTGAPRIIVDDDLAEDPDADVLVVTMRARAVAIWKWEDDHLVRATPRARLPVPQLPPGCP